MKRKVARLRLSPNEEARIIREEHERRRKLRIQQVREQQRYIALQIRREVEQKRQRELQQLEGELREAWERQQREKLHTLQKLYEESLQLLGQGHRSAKENEPDLAAIAQREEENHAKAEVRYREALKELKSQRLKDHERNSRCINARKKALEAEKERSAKVASLPPPPPDPIQNIDSKRPHVVKKSDVSAFAATHYHMPESAVDRELDTKQPSAREGAEREARRLQDLQREEGRRREEQLEKARLRGNQALRREHLVQDRERLLVELQHLQQTDLLRRRQQVSQMPPQIFQPLYKRQETREDFQREMEFAFEDLYTGERRVKGDLVVQLVPEPLPALSTDSKDQELDVTLDEISTEGTENTQLDTEGDAGRIEQEASAQAEPTRPAPRRALKKLLDRIRSQRTQWTDLSSRVPPPLPPTDASDQIPERDTTIDTGSLTGEDKDTAPAVELPEPTHSPPEPSPAADNLPPDDCANRVQEFEERKKRQEELEREKEQQMVLLQELEEQKSRLEQMLFEAQQEREHLKAAVTQNEPAERPEAPVGGQHAPSDVTTEPVPPAAEDDHTRRIREYQQRLLQQNKTHQRSVEVARQRLEEYQRALRIRHSMTATSLPPAISPPNLLHPPLHSTQSVHLPLPHQLPTTPAVPPFTNAEPVTSVDVPTRECDMSASPPLLPVFTSGGCSGMQPDEVESISNTPRIQRSDASAWLADNIMERVTQHLPVRMRPSSVTTEPPPHNLFTPHRSTITPPQPPSGPTHTASPSATEVGQPGGLSSTEEDMERQRRELQEAQRRMLQQREAVALQQRRREEERRWRQEVEMEQMRRQKESLQALIHTDAEPVPEAASDMMVSESISQNRLKLLASLLRAIEETNGGTLSHLEELPEGETPPHTAPPSQRCTSAAPPSVLLPPRAAKPPVSRARLGAMEMMTEQHELSAIQEVETPVNISQVAGLEGGEEVPSVVLHCDLQEEWEASAASHSSPPSSRGSCGASSRSGSDAVWRERRLTGAQTSPESDSALRMMSPLSSDSGRGADCSGPAVTSCRSPSESAHRPPDSDCLCSTISTGSYITTDPENNSNTDKSPSLGRHVEERRGADLIGFSSASDQSSGVDGASDAGRAGLAVHSLFNDSSIQRIIDRYTRELNISLSTTGKTTDGEGSRVEENDSAASQRASVVRFSERRDGDDRSLHSNTAAAPRSGLDWDDPVLEHFSGQDQDSFRPLIGRLADHSSCLAADGRDSSVALLIGQPSAHSSLIGQPPASVGSAGWDSTLSRMIGRLSHHGSSHWLSGGRDFYAAQLMGQMASGGSTTWLDGGAEDSQMRPLVGELDESTEQHSGSSGRRTLVDLGGPSDLTLPPEASPLCGSVHSGTLPQDRSGTLPQDHSGTLPQDRSGTLRQDRSGTLRQDRTGTLRQDRSGTLPQDRSGTLPQDRSGTLPQDRSSRVEQSPERAEVFPGSDSFHPLQAEVTHNEMADASMTFHPPGHAEPSPPAGRTAAVSPDDSVLDAAIDPSPERLRAAEPSPADPPASEESFSLLIVSQCHPHGSTASPTGRTDVETTALSLSNLTVNEDSPVVAADRRRISELCAGELQREQVFNPRDGDKPLVAAGVKGILEQSEITLVSLTDTTLPDQDTTFTEEEEEKEEGGMWEEEPPKGLKEEGPKCQETEGSEATSLQAETPRDQTHPVTFLEVQWGPSSGVNQQRRGALLQRSSRRVDELKAKQQQRSHSPAPPGPRDQVPVKDSHPFTCKTKTEPRRPHKRDVKSSGGQTEPHQSASSGLTKQRTPQHPPPASVSVMKTVAEVKVCMPEKRKRDVSEMHQRTQRLYEQLEEVKQQKEIRSRREAYAENRLKAKEFHKKTLQKLRAKRTPQ